MVVVDCAVEAKLIGNASTRDEQANARYNADRNPAAACKQSPAKSFKELARGAGKGRWCQGGYANSSTVFSTKSVYTGVVLMAK